MHTLWRSGTAGSRSAWPEITELGFDMPFKRMWEYYLSYCEAGFKAGNIDVGLFKIRRSA